MVRLNVALQNQETLCAIRQKETSYVLVDANMQAKVVSTLEAFQSCQCDAKTSAVALPSNIAKIQQAAEQELINYQNKLIKLLVMLKLHKRKLNKPKVMLQML